MENYPEKLFVFENPRLALEDAHHILWTMAERIDREGLEMEKSNDEAVRYKGTGMRIYARNIESCADILAGARKDPRGWIHE